MRKYEKVSSLLDKWSHLLLPAMFHYFKSEGMMDDIDDDTG